MSMSLATLLLLRRAALHFVHAVEHALFEAYGWRPKQMTVSDEG